MITKVGLGTWNLEITVCCRAASRTSSVYSVCALVVYLGLYVLHSLEMGMMWVKFPNYTSQHIRNANHYGSHTVLHNLKTVRGSISL